MARITKKIHEFYGYRIVQNPSNKKLTLYVGALDAQILRDIASVDNAVKWDKASNLWRDQGRNRTIEETHWKSIREFLSSENYERILPSAIVLSVEESAFDFQPFQKMPVIDGVVPGVIKIEGRYRSRSGQRTPCPENLRSAWVLDGQHRIMAFRDWAMPEPYPVNVIVIKAWSGSDYEDVMLHQTYELNMGRPLSEDFKAAVREQYDQQIGHRAYKQQIALSWIRKDLEGRGEVFSPDGVVGAAKLRTPYVITMSFLEKLIALAFDHDPYLRDNYSLQKMDKSEVKNVGKYLFDFYEGVRLSLGVINPNTKGTIGSEPEVDKAIDYWDIARKTKHKQRILHNVGLKSITRGLLNRVMRSDYDPKSPEEVAKLLEKMKGIPWHDDQLQSKKDDWVPALSEALKNMYKSRGTLGGRQYRLKLEKKDKTGNAIDQYILKCYGWED